MSEKTKENQIAGLGIELVFDGGSRGNPGRAYGSYQIKYDGAKARKPIRLHLGQGTNNEAEYLTLIRALEDLRAELEQKNIDPTAIQLKIFGDSQLVIQQLNGQWKAKNARMRALRDKALQLVKPFGSFEIQHHARWRSVAALGH